MQQIVALTVAFFIVVWAILLLFLGVLSKKHSWILPVFAIGLGAPRWCQMLWGTTFIGVSVPWADIGIGMSRIQTGLLLGKSLWLWLGVLDAVQGVGFGMMLLQVFLPLALRLMSIDFDADAYRVYPHYRTSARICCDHLRSTFCSG